ncbi:MAG: gamma-glutamyltransferase, partial [Alphaproteobacteria bacterium]
ILVAAALAACSPSDETLRAVGLIEGDVGGVSADEPRAALVARTILGNQGNAADAAVALYFTTAVTFPASASLGSGGACLVFDSATATVETLAFPATVPAGTTDATALKIAIPGAVRGMFALHARYGKLTWNQLLSPAEQAARLGHPMSRALATDLARVAEPLFNNPGIAAVFGRDDGSPLGEGDMLVQLDLSTVISQLRTRGPGGFYSGTLARQLVDAVNAAGGSLTIDDMRGYKPVWGESLQIPLGDDVLHTMGPPLPGGVSLFQMWRMLTLDDRYEDATPDERRHLMAEASMRAFADRSAWQATGADGADLIGEDHIVELMAGYGPDSHTAANSLAPPPVKHRESPSGTSLVVVDGSGSAVACSFTLNNFFGRGWMAPGTGIIMAAAKPPSRSALSALAPVMLVNHNTGNFVLAAAASGGAAAPSALVEVMTRTLIDGQSLVAAVAAPRLYHGGRPDVAIVEPDEPADMLDGLRRRGHLVAQAPEIGGVNAVYCREGMQENAAGCSVSADRRGHGLASFVQFE